MAIEVRQLIVKSVVEQKPTTPGEQPQACCDVEQLKADLLQQCRRLIVETLRREKER